MLGLLAGLGLSNNHSLVLLAPLGIFGVFQGIREAARDRQADGVRHAALKEGAVGLAIAIAAALAGLLPYATLPAQFDGAFVWGDVSTFDGLLHHFLRADYGTTSLGITEGDTSAIQHIGALVFTFCDQLHWVFVGVLGVGLVRLWIASAGPGGRASVIALWLALSAPGRSLWPSSTSRLRLAVKIRSASTCCLRREHGAARHRLRHLPRRAAAP